MFIEFLRNAIVNHSICLQCLFATSNFSNIENLLGGFVTGRECFFSSCEWFRGKHSITSPLSLSLITGKYFIKNQE